LIKRIDVNLDSRSYFVHVENGILNHAGEIIRKTIRSKKMVILSVPRIFNKYGRAFGENLRREGIDFSAILIPDGESQKTQRSLLLILSEMARRGLQRDSALVSLGGGVVGDLGGLAASLYMRGINFLQCPTTLLAQVDASVGGKTAIDFVGVKNLVGTFYQPKLVLIDPLVLKSLEDRQYRTGLAEVIKYGVIQDEDLFKKIEDETVNIIKREPKILVSLIARSCKIKAKIVSEDERENGKRAWLNYGHTLGHALESYFNYKTLTHGEAIAYGMSFAAKLSQRMNLCSRGVVQRQNQLLQKVGLFRKLPTFNPRMVYKKMFLDKKSRSGQVQFILTRKIGLVTIQKNISQSIILSALTQFQTDANGLY
jgi:3-dehydroquinate synthase